MFNKAAYIFVNNNNSPDVDLVSEVQTLHHIFDWRQSKSWDEPAIIKNTAKVTYRVNWFFKRDFDHWKCSLFGWLTRKFQIAKVFCSLDNLWRFSKLLWNYCFFWITGDTLCQIRVAAGIRKTVSFPDPSPAKLSVGCESSLITCYWPWSRQSREGRRWGAFEETNDETEKL